MKQIFITFAHSFRSGHFWTSFTMFQIIKIVPMNPKDNTSDDICFIWSNTAWVSCPSSTAVGTRIESRHTLVCRSRLQESVNHVVSLTELAPQVTQCLQVSDKISSRLTGLSRDFGGDHWSKEGFLVVGQHGSVVSGVILVLSITQSYGWVTRIFYRVHIDRGYHTVITGK